jgi:hypothetical protein
MTRAKRRWIVGLVLVLGLLGSGAGGLWWALGYQPDFYRERVQISPARRHAEAQLFEARSLQLRNDIANEARWEAVFTDEQVNAWLAEDLVTSLADLIPPGVGDPRIVFQPDRVTLAFRYEDGPIRSVVWAVVRIALARDNELTLTLEGVRAGALPVPHDRLLRRFTEHAHARGLDLRWERDGDLPMALIRYTPSPKRRDLVLETLQVADGWIRLAGRSAPARVAVAPRLPTRHVLQSTFPRRSVQVKAPAGVPDASARSSAGPL